MYFYTKFQVILESIGFMDKVYQKQMNNNIHDKINTNPLMPSGNKKVIHT